MSGTVFLVEGATEDGFTARKATDPYFRRISNGFGFR